MQEEGSDEFTHCTCAHFSASLVQSQGTKKMTPKLDDPNMAYAAHNE